MDIHFSNSLHSGQIDLNSLHHHRGLNSQKEMPPEPFKYAASLAFSPFTTRLLSFSWWKWHRSRFDPVLQAVRFFVLCVIFVQRCGQRPFCLYSSFVLKDTQCWETTSSLIQNTHSSSAGRKQLLSAHACASCLSRKDFLSTTARSSSSAHALARAQKRARFSSLLALALLETAATACSWLIMLRVCRLAQFCSTQCLKAP